jgi:hypothetical protein
MIITTRRAAWSLSTLALAIGLAACAGSPTSPSVTPPPPVVVDSTMIPGSYGLSTVNTKALPTVILSDSLYKLEVISATATMTSAHHFTIAITTRETVDGNVSTYTDTVAGSWSVSGLTITLVSVADGSVATATWDATHLVVSQMDATARDSYGYVRKP